MDRETNMYDPASIHHLSGGVLGTAHVTLFAQPIAGDRYFVIQGEWYDSCRDDKPRLWVGLTSLKGLIIDYPGMPQPILVPLPDRRYFTRVEYQVGGERIYLHQLAIPWASRSKSLRRRWRDVPMGSLPESAKREWRYFWIGFMAANNQWVIAYKDYE